MTPAEFIEKWSGSRLTERQGSQHHFLDLCALLGEPVPSPDTIDTYCFERGAEKVGGGDGWADVWRKRCFGWEYKGKHKDLNAALRQLQAYALDLENPPYLVVSDMERIIVHTNWTNTVSRRIEFSLDDLHEPAKLDLLRQVFQGSEALKPGVTPQELTRKVAERFGELSRRLQERKLPPRAVAHFLNRLVFCMFAEDAKLLPEGLFTRLIKATQAQPAFAQDQLRELFGKMARTITNPLFGTELIKWFDGGLFEDAEVLPLDPADLKLIGDTAAEHDWSEIDPAIFGTLFEQALKATRERPALGAHYTDREKIMKIVEPVIIRPLMAEWEETRAEIVRAMEGVAQAEAERRGVFEAAAEAMQLGAEAVKAGEAARRKQVAAITRNREAAYGRAKEALESFLAHLGAYRVLDPACGSGNFLYVALHALKDIELRALVDAERLGVVGPAPRVGLQCVKGIEVEPYAAELARVTLWIGDLQWMRKNGFTGYTEPILSKLDQIEERDAVLNPDGSEAIWPAADVIIGNPPFVGGKRLRSHLGDAYVDQLFHAYAGRVPAEADFVCYWIEKAWRAIGVPSPSWQFGAGKRAGLVTTNSIRGGASRKVLEPVAAAGAIREAWSDEPWVLEGAAVRVSMIGFGWGMPEQRLDGHAVDQINPDLTGAGIDLTRAQRLTQNLGIAFMGDTKGGPFDVPGDLAREWLKLPLNPNGRPNSDVLKPWRNGMDVTRRPADKWIIDFGWTMTEAEAAMYQAPYEYARKVIAPERLRTQREEYRTAWWRHVRPRPDMWRALAALSRCIVTPEVAKHRVFAWFDTQVVPDHKLQVFASDSEALFGILHSRIHEVWSLRVGSWHGVGNDPRYTISTTFETFPLPEGKMFGSADQPMALLSQIEGAAAELNNLRDAWLNPADLVVIEPEVVPGYPARIMPKDEHAAKSLRARTLTNLYNERPAWLDNAHKALDAAVAAAYGWPADLSDDEIVQRLFELNEARASAAAATT